MKSLAALPLLALLVAPLPARADSDDPVYRDIAQILALKTYVTHLFDVCSDKYGGDPAYAAARADWLKHNEAPLAAVETAIAHTGKFSEDDRNALQRVIFRQVEESLAGQPDPAVKCKAIADDVIARNRDIEDMGPAVDALGRLKKL